MDAPDGLGADPFGPLDADCEVAAIDTLETAPSEAELLEFLASDLDPVPVDPVFRERLREQLWSMVETAGAKGSGEV